MHSVVALRCHWESNLVLISHKQAEHVDVESPWFIQTALNVSSIGCPHSCSFRNVMSVGTAQCTCMHQQLVHDTLPAHRNICMQKAATAGSIMQALGCFCPSTTRLTAQTAGWPKLCSKRCTHWLVQLVSLVSMLYIPSTVGAAVTWSFDRTAHSVAVCGITLLHL